MQAQAMINYQRFTLSNGLRVLVNADPSTPLSVLNLFYDVGARDESPHRTGMAHLFEHLMFTGSQNIPNFDAPLHKAGGECNAFTSADMTNYYDLLPANNIETAFWLESDRMLALNLKADDIQSEKDVVCEEFKENYIDQPYGDVWHHLRALSYKEHPYQWPVIGKALSHIQEASPAELQAFYRKHYAPDNAILTVAGGVTVDQVERLAEKWFGQIPASGINGRKLPKEPLQTEFRSKTLKGDVPMEAIYMAFHICDRHDPDHHVVDLINEVLGGGDSGRLFRRLVIDRPLFSSLSCSLSDNYDEGLFILNGSIQEGVDIKAAEQAVWEELYRLTQEQVSQQELEKVKHKIESSIIYSEIGLGTRAFYLAYFEWLGDVEEINTEIHKYLSITTEDLQRVAKDIFKRENCSTIYYLPEKKSV